MNQLGGQPIFILPEGSLRNTGKDAQSRNIAAAKAVAESVRTTLGPKGMDKMLVNSIGDVTITNDGVTILEEMEVEHPAAKMIVEVAKTQENEVGDGTTTAVVIAGELLKKAEGLLEQEVHPTVIVRGYRLAKSKSIEVLNSFATKVSLEDEDLLKKIATTAITGKSGETAKDSLSALAVQAVKLVAEKQDGSVKINKDDIKIEKKHGASVEDSELIKGLVIDKEVVHPGMPKIIKGAKIALLDCALEVKETERTTEIRVNTPEQLQAFLEQESAMLKSMVKKVVDSGANVAFCQKGIDDLAQHYLAKNNITAARRVKKSDIEMLAKATGAKIISSVDELSKTDLGYAGLVEERKIAGDQMIFVRECKDPKAVSILARGSTEHVVDEVKRGMDDAVLGIIAALENGKVVFGGGSSEIELSRRLKTYADSVGGREQLAINAFAEALEIIPRTLAESTGRDPIDILVDLRTKHDKGGETMGVDVFKAGVADMKQMGVVEPLKTKTQAITSASEAAEMILRIDDVITSKSTGTSAPPMPGGEMGE
ncbi:MAG: TCP-1/cpn60 chaperonin family protein [Candidatus Aenigmarchaeota archaeon]|nr:TCP-1/cpn60 chaperonin family protein [Candidatus Aenigmarchaeota archaeon]